MKEAFFNNNDYKITSTILGEGSYGKVYIAENVHNGEKCALKNINIESGFDGQEQISFLQESLILHKLNHPSIVKYDGINFKSLTSNNNLLQPTIITKYFSHGSLNDILNKENKSQSAPNWTPTKKYINLLGISHALRYLHQKGILHLNLKPENILFDSNYYPHVSDFGLSKCFSNIFTKSVKLTIEGQLNTPIYFPPEILRGEENFDQSVDVYAYAMIAFEIVTGERPFSELGQISPTELSNKITSGYRPNFPSSVTQRMQQLISKCWSESRQERPTFDDIFNDFLHHMSQYLESIDEAEIKQYIASLCESNQELPQAANDEKFERNSTASDYL